MTQKGAATIVLTIVILNTVFLISLGISALMISQIETTRQAGTSVVAFYAADAGAEKCLYEVRKNGASSCPYTDVPLDFNSDATYTTSYDDSRTITSVGEFGGASRKIEVTW